MSASRRTRPSSLSDVQTAIISCEQCPRLRSYCVEVGRTKKASFRNDLYWARPVPGFGDPHARVLILGLAPAAHGANRTGRVFTGDGVGASGDFLMAALKRAGFANIATSQRIDDGLVLTDAYIAAAVRCAPPDNKPLPEEVDRCLPHLVHEVSHLQRLQIVVALGKIAWDSWFKLLAIEGVEIPRPKPVFAHGQVVHLRTLAPSHPRTLISPVATEHEHRRRDSEDVRRGVSDRERIPALMNERYARMALAAVFFFYVLVMRTYDVASTFLMLGEQTRDWTIALGNITDLPLVGAPSTAGGRGFGPAYYWLLWIGRVTIGPFMDNLPHAGGVVVALLQSIADTWLLIVLSRRVHWGLALAMCLLIASAPFDIAISSVIWNPPVSAALIKMATAMALMLKATSPRWHIAVTAVLAWMAVQAHLSAIFVAAPMLAAIPIQSFVERSSNNRRTIVERAFIIAGVILILQVPFLFSVLSEPDAPVGPGAAIAGLTNPQTVRPWFAYDSVTGITGNLLLPMPDGFSFAIATLLVGAIVGFAYRRDPVILATSIGGVIMATLLFTTSTRNYDGYWFLTLTTALALTYGMAIAAIPSKTAVKWSGLAILLIVAWRQPSRIADSTRFFEYPQYDTMVRASRELIQRAPVVRDIKVAFEVHPTMDRHFIYRILGGRIDGSALYTAVIYGDGSIKLE